MDKIRLISLKGSRTNRRYLFRELSKSDRRERPQAPKGARMDTGKIFKKSCIRYRFYRQSRAGTN